MKRPCPISELKIIAMSQPWDDVSSDYRRMIIPVLAIINVDAQFLIAKKMRHTIIVYHLSDNKIEKKSYLKETGVVFSNFFLVGNFYNHRAKLYTKKCFFLESFNDLQRKSH